MATVSAELRASALRLCVAAVERFLDLLHQMALGSSPDELAWYWMPPSMRGNPAAARSGLRKSDSFVSLICHSLVTLYVSVVREGMMMIARRRPMAD